VPGYDDAQWAWDTLPESVKRGVALQVPLHLTGFFCPVYGDTPETTGSLGAGIVIEPGLSCSIGPGSGVLLNGEDMGRGPARDIYESLGGGFSVNLSCRVSPGAGYALSAASSLAVAACYAIRGDVALGEVGVAAHVAEVRWGTGLGDVLAIWGGRGLTVRRRAGAPGVGEVEWLRIGERIVVLTYELGRLPTSELLRSRLPTILEEGRRAYRIFASEPSLELFLQLANRFSRRLGLVDRRMEEAVRNVEDLILGWFVKKRVLVMLVEEGLADEVAKNTGLPLEALRVFRPGERVWRTYLETILDTLR